MCILHGFEVFICMERAIEGGGAISCPVAILAAFRTLKVYAHFANVCFGNYIIAAVVAAHSGDCITAKRFSCL